MPLHDATEPTPARVRIYNDGLFDNLTEDAPQMSPTKSNVSDGSRGGLQQALRMRSRAEKKKKMLDEEEQRERRYQRHREQSLRLQAESERAVRERLADQALRKEERFQEFHSDLSAGNQLAEQVRVKLDLQESADKNKVKRQFEEWNQNVYGKIQGMIADDLNSREYKQINARRRREFQQFLDTTNSKGAIFRDIIIESEYDPLQSNRECIKVAHGRLHDPTSRVIDKHYEESGMLSGAVKPPAPHARETLEITLWGTGKIESTPHGFFAKIMKQNKNPGAMDAAAVKQESKTWTSHIPFDHYNVAKGKAVTDQEFPVGKRTRPAPAPDDDVFKGRSSGGMSGLVP